MGTRPTRRSGAAGTTNAGSRSGRGAVFTDAVTPFRLLDAHRASTGRARARRRLRRRQDHDRSGPRRRRRRDRGRRDLSTPLRGSPGGPRWRRPATPSFHVVDMQHDDRRRSVRRRDEPVRRDVLRRTGHGVPQHPRALCATARLGFACWQPLERNPWFFALALAPFLAPPPPPAEGKSPTGPFALGDPERTAGILRAAGFSDIRRTATEFTVDLPEDAIVDDGQLEFMGRRGRRHASPRGRSTSTCHGSV